MARTEMTEIKVADQFTPYPFGRYPTHGPYSGQRFREEILRPAITNGDRFVVIDFTGVRSYSSSFLEEVFGGLVRAGIDPELLKDRVRIVAGSDSFLESEVIGYIDEASNHLMDRRADGALKMG